jgi:hypothetical protein
MKERGQIWRYSEESFSGFIVGNDNQTYRFSITDFLSGEDMIEGNVVEFRKEGKSAKDIVLLGTTQSPAKTKGGSAAQGA